MMLGTTAAMRDTLSVTLLIFNFNQLSLSIFILSSTEYVLAVSENFLQPDEGRFVINLAMCWIYIGK